MRFIFSTQSHKVKFIVKHEMEVDIVILLPHILDCEDFSLSGTSLILSPVFSLYKASAILYLSSVTFLSCQGAKEVDSRC